MPAPKGNQYAKGNPGGGAQSMYTPKMLKQVEMACRAGFTDAEIADLLGVTEQTINNWKHEQEEFGLVLKKAKADYDDGIVEHALRKRALGFHRTVERTTKDGVVACMEEVPPDTTACIFWLKNRKPKEWRDKQELEHSQQGPMVAVLKTGDD